MGNYADATYKVYRGSINEINEWSEVDSTNGTDVSNAMLTTGAYESNSAKNIYDVAGNCSEMTTEFHSSGYRIMRGRYV